MIETLCPPLALLWRFDRDMRYKCMLSDTLRILHRQVVPCERCPRLRAHGCEVARVKRRAYLDWEYWGKPVPGFGDNGTLNLRNGVADDYPGAAYAITSPPAIT